MPDEATPRYARGGIIPGPGGTTDDIPVTITSGEWRITPEHAKALLQKLCDARDA